MSPYLGRSRFAAIFTVLCAAPAPAFAQANGASASSPVPAVEPDVEGTSPASATTPSRALNAIHTPLGRIHMPARARVQVGPPGSTYYGVELGASGPISIDRTPWEIVQHAHVDYEPTFGDKLTVQVGLFPSSVGPDGVTVKDDWTWMPPLHAGARATQQITDELSISAAVYTGWNAIADTSSGSAFSLQLAYNEADALLVGLLYFGSVEAPEGAPSRPLRHIFDAWAQVRPTDRLWLTAWGNAGFERGDLGFAWWGGGALQAQLRVGDGLTLSARGSYVNEHTVEGDGASRMLLPAEWIASGSAAAELHPQKNTTVRFEYRHDQAADDTSFVGMFQPAASPAGQFIRNGRAHDTLTVGLTSTF